MSDPKAKLAGIVMRELVKLEKFSESEMLLDPKHLEALELLAKVLSKLDDAAPEKPEAEASAGDVAAALALVGG
jgi:hypothetical protein